MSLDGAKAAPVLKHREKRLKVNIPVANGQVRVKPLNSSIENMAGGIKLPFTFFAIAFLRKWDGLLPGKTTRFDE